MLAFTSLCSATGFGFSVELTQLFQPVAVLSVRAFCVHIYRVRLTHCVEIFRAGNFLDEMNLLLNRRGGGRKSLPSLRTGGRPCAQKGEQCHTSETRSRAMTAVRLRLCDRAT